MQIGSTLPVSLPVAPPRRDPAAARAPVETVEPVVERASREVFRLRASDRAIESGGDEQRLQGFPPQSRNALQSYLSNGPSLSERLGVELAGVDVYA